VKHPRFSLVLLVVGFLLSYAWYWVPAQFAAHAQNVAGAALTIFCLGLIGLLLGSAEAWIVVGLLASFKAMVIGCTAWFLLDPWPIRPGQALCSARLNWPLGLLGVGAAGIIYLRIIKKETT
jgi:hypothetical protein